MITQEMFDGIVKKIADKETCTVEEVTELVQTIAELEQRSMVSGQVVEFVLHAAEQVANDVIDKVMRNLNLRDLDKVKQVRSISSKTSEGLSAVTQLYIAQMFAHLNQGSAVADTDPSILDDEATA